MSKRLKIVNICINCEVEFHPHHSTAGKYCSSKCMAVHRQKLTPFSELKQDRTRRYALIRLRGHCCEVCKNTEWNRLPIPLEIDHIDGNHQNNDLTNVRLLCPNCHAQTPTYKARNKGNGREHRRKNNAA